MLHKDFSINSRKKFELHTEKELDQIREACIEIQSILVENLTILDIKLVF